MGEEEFIELGNYGKYDINRVFKNFPSEVYTNNNFMNLLILFVPSFMNSI